MTGSNVGSRVYLMSDETTYQMLKLKNQEFTFKSGLLKRNGRIYVPDNGTLRGDLIAAYHNHQLQGHPAEKKTKRLINQVFYWPNSGKDIHRYIQSCHPCMHSKARRKKLLCIVPNLLLVLLTSTLDAEYLTPNSFPLPKSFRIMTFLLCRNCRIIFPWSCNC